MSKRGHFRNISITLPEEIIPLYFDKEKNVVFNEIYLEEEDTTQETAKAEIHQEDLISLVRNLAVHLDERENKEPSLIHIQKNFVLDKFTGKQNANEWMNFFERECTRNQVGSSEKKIHVLRLLVEDNAKEWYSANIAKLTIEGDWEDWKKSFMETYADKSWRLIHYAYSYKWISGPLIDYALKKENLLLETEPKMSDCSRINHIVIGLPTYVQDKLDKEEISTTEKLMNQLRRYTQPPMRGPKREKLEGKKISTTVRI